MNDRLESKVLQYQNYVYEIARMVYMKHHRCIELDDLVQYGQVGLVEALKSYDESRGVAFKLFAYSRIRGAIYDGLKKSTEFMKSRWYRDKIRHALANIKMMSSGLDNDGAAVDKIEKLRRVVKLFSQAYVLSLDAVSAMSDEKSPEQFCIGSQFKQQLQEALSKLTLKEYLIIKYCYYEDMNIACAGAKIGISRSWALRLHARAINRLYDELCKII